MTATIAYEGNLRCTAIHERSNTTIETDAPADNKGKGERFSPTDLICTALATCMITTMAIKASSMELELKGTTASVKKHMASDPRRIAKIEVTLTFPTSIVLDEKETIILKRTAEFCPVMLSLHPDVEVAITYVNI